MGDEGISQWGNGGMVLETERRKYLRENLLQCYFVHLKYQKDCPGNKVSDLHLEKPAIYRLRKATVWFG
jgi:hypothetical protein